MTEAKRSSETEIVRAARRKLVPYAIGAVIFVVGSIGILGRGGPTTVAIGLAALAFFGACLLFVVVSLVHPPIIVLFGPEGVTVPTGFRRRHAPLVPWSAIKSVRVYRFEAAAFSPGIRMLGLVPTDPQDAVWTSQRMRRANRRLTGLALSIPGQLIAGELEELATAFRRYRADLPVEYGEPRAAGMGWITRPPRRRPKP